MIKLNLKKIYKDLPENRVKIDIFEEIDSTNDEAKKITLDKEFHIIIAEQQSKGRGRHGNKWSSPNSQNIYMTFCTENDLSFAPISLVAGVICKNSIKNIHDGVNIDLKWPNDLLHKNKKVGGILVEKVHYRENIKTIVGIGINLNLKNKESWWGDLSEFNLVQYRNELINEIINNFINVSDRGRIDWMNEWRKGCLHLGKEIEIYDDNKIIQTAIFRDVDSEGNAIIITKKGLEIFKSGQIKIKGIY